MSSATTSIVSNADVDFYFTGVNTAFLRALKGNNKAIYPKIAYVVPAGRRTSSTTPIDLPDGSQAAGTKIKFPISLAASRPEVWQYGTSRKQEPYSQVEQEVILQRWAPPAKVEYFDVFANDKFDIVKGQLPQMLDRSLILWDMVLAARLAENAVGQANGLNGYDALPFFTPQATPHQANPFKPGVGTFYNDVPITSIDVPTIRMLLSLLEAAPGPDGLPLDTSNVKAMFLAPNKDVEFQLRQILFGAITAQAVGANAAAGVSNALMGAADVVLFKQLLTTRNAPVFNSNAQPRDRVFYLLAVPDGEDRPLAVVPQREPTAFYSGLNGADHIRVKDGAIIYGWDAFGEARLTIPQRAIRVVLNPV